MNLKTGLIKGGIIAITAGLQVITGIAISKPQAKLIVPLTQKVEPGKLPAPSDLNQCAGTVQHYYFPASGYLPPPETVESRQGKQLYAKLDCASCHAIAGQGGTLGPPLDGIGGHRGRDFVIARMLDPETQMREFPEAFGGRPNIMPHPQLNRKHAEILADYLLTLPEPPGGFLLQAHGLNSSTATNAEDVTWLQFNRNPQDVVAGGKLFSNRGCAACHQAGGSGGYLAPALDGISSRRAAKDILELLTDQASDPGMCRSVSLLTDKQRRDIMAFLASLKPEGPTAPYRGRPLSADDASP